MEWKMLNNNEFIAEPKDGHEIRVIKSDLGWIWAIISHNSIVDHAMYHRPSKGGELGAKVQAEKFYKQLQF